MKKFIFSLFIFSFLTISRICAQLAPVEKGLQAITQDALKAQLGFLASDWMEGRMAGEKGEFLAADYIASMLQLNGVKPGGDYFRTRTRGINMSGNERSYFQNFTLLKTLPGKEQTLMVRSYEGKTTRTTSFNYTADFIFRGSYPGIEVEAPVVFAGYGFKNEKLKFNDFSRLDVKGKFILKISGTPEFAQKLLSPDELSASAREVEVIARENGAVGIIEFNPNSTIVGTPVIRDFNNMSPAENNPRPEGFNARYSIPGIKNPDILVRIIVSVKTANDIVNGTGNDIEDYLKKADGNIPYTFSQMSDKSLYLKSTNITSLISVRNVIGIIEGTNPEQVIVLGAHYDHMGMNNGYIWNGADDNGSGTVGVMTLSRAIMQTGIRPEKTIIVALWTAEEEGLLGSRYWIQNPTCPLNNVRLNVNFDMISRYITDDEPKKVTMTYTSTNSGFKNVTTTNLKKYGIDLEVDYQPSADPPGGTDHRSFVAVGIPIMRFKPGHREEYHTPLDEFNTIDWDIMEKIVRISFLNIWELANTDW
jgi:hypothetical protein